MGKLLTSLVLGVVSMVVLAVATHLALGAHWGDPLGVALLIVAGVLAATAVMALVATLARTPDQAQAWGSMAALVLGMLGGSFFPIAQAGGALAALSLVSPHAWFLRGLQELSGGAGASAALGPAAAILAFAALAGGLAALRVKRLVRCEGAGHRRHGPAAAAALARERVLPLPAADDHHPAARGRVRRLAGADRRGRRHRAARPPARRPGSTRSAPCRCERFADERALRRAVARGRIDAGLVVPADYDARLRAGGPTRCATSRAPTRSRSSSAATVQAVAADEAASSAPPSSLHVSAASRLRAARSRAASAIAAARAAGDASR